MFPGKQSLAEKRIRLPCILGSLSLMTLITGLTADMDFFTLGGQFSLDSCPRTPRKELYRGRRGRESCENGASRAAQGFLGDRIPMSVFYF